jgi:hypothetical protein
MNPVDIHGIHGLSPNGIAVGPDGTIYADTYLGNGFTDKTAIVAISPDGHSARMGALVVKSERLGARNVWLRAAS